MTEQEIADSAWRWNPLGRVGQPDDIAEMVHFLSSETTARFITGQIFVVDGGALATR